MASNSWGDIYKNGGGSVALPAGPYEVEVSATRTKAKETDKSIGTIFLDLDVVAGPSAGAQAQGMIAFPKANQRGALHFFFKKLAGFGDLSAVFSQFDTADDAAKLEILADSLVGRRVIAVFSLRQDGEYAGSNQLEETKPVDDIPAAPVAPVAKPAAVPAPAPAQAVSDQSLPF